MMQEVRLRATLVLLVALVACRQKYPLSEVPVLGGTEEERELLRAELEAYQQAIGPDRVELYSVEIVDELESGIAGQYDDQRIWLTYSSMSLTYVLRHEICHALDSAEDLLNRPHPLFDELAAGLFTGDLSDRVSIHKHYRSARAQRREALADFCGLGPTALIGLLDRCPGQSPLSEEVAAWLMDNVYRDYPLLPPMTFDPAQVVTLDAWVRGGPPVVLATTSPGTVWVTEDQEDPDWKRQVDLYTGQVLDTAFEPVPNAEEPPPPRGVSTRDRVGWPEGPAAAQGYVDAHHLNGGGERLFIYDTDEAAWRTVAEDCELPDNAALFTADGQVWRSWTEGSVLRWAPLSE